MACQPFCEHDFLLVAATQPPRDSIRIRGLDAQLIDHPLRLSAFPRGIDQSPVRHPAMIRQRDVPLDGQAQHEAMCLAIFRQEPDALAHGCGGRFQTRGLPRIVIRPSSIGSAPMMARASSVRPGADEPGNPQDLTGMQGQMNVVENSTAREPFDAQQFAAAPDLPPRVLVRDVAVCHHLNELAGGHVRQVPASRRSGHRAAP